VLVQTRVRQTAVEGLDVGVLRRLAGLDEAELDLVFARPLIKRPARELRAAVGLKRGGITPPLGDGVEHPDRASRG
jgi:hypothetical protein